MKKRVAVEFFGQLRNWELNTSLGRIVSFFNNKGYEVDFFGTFWNDDYSRKHIASDNFNNFKAVLLVDEPDLPDEIERPTLKKYFYSIHNSNELRKAYRLKNKIKYDFVLMMRPDINVHLSSRRFDENIKVINGVGGKPYIFFDTKSLGPYVTDEGRMLKKVEDKFVILNEAGADYLAQAYFKLDYFRYHSSLMLAAEEVVKSIEYIDAFIRPDLIRVDLITPYTDMGWDDAYLDDEVGFVRHHIKRYQDTDELVNEIERLVQKLRDNYPDLTLAEATKMLKEPRRNG